MKNSFIKWAMPAFAIIAMSTGCSDNEGCTDPNAINYDAEAETDNGSCVYDSSSAEVSIHFHSKLGAADFAYDTDALNWDGRKVRFTRAQFYMSKVSLGTQAFGDKYFLVNPDVEHYVLGNIAAGHHHDLVFNVGVDSASNHLDPATWPSNHALSSNNPDHFHWGWDPGYIFIALEGLVDTTADKSGEANAPFIFHIGMDNLLTQVELMAHADVEGNTMVTVEIDWLKFFTNIDMRTDNFTHTMGNMMLAQAVKNNVNSVFTVE
jgi:hypothetical protein